MARTLIFIFVFITSLLPDSAQEPCAHFTFPTFKTRDVVAEENTTISLPFQLTTQTCPADMTRDYRIKVAKKESLTYFRHICNIHHRNGICLKVNDSTCRCMGDGSYLFVHALNREDSTTWTFFTDPGFAVQYELEFNIVYPSKVTSLILTNSSNDLIEGAVPRYSMVNITCLLERGNPPRMPRLLVNDLPEPVLLPPRSEVIQHTLPSVTCDKAGEIRCNVPGASKNKSITLLVKCPPQFVDAGKKEEYTVKERESQNLHFHVRSHSTTIKKCRMTLDKVYHRKRPSATRSKDCLNSTKLNGTPPDLKLTVELTDVKRQDAGEWQLMLTNDVDSRHTNFVLRVLYDDTDVSAVTNLPVPEPDIYDETGDGDSVTTPTRADDDGDEGARKSDSNTVVTVAVPLFSAVVVVVVIVVASFKNRCCCLRVYRSRPTYEEPGQPARREVGLKELTRHRQSVPSQHIYCDVQEVMVRPAGQGCLVGDAYDVAKQSTYDQTSSYALLNPTYQPLRVAYDNFRKLSRRLSRGLYRRRSEIEAEDQN